MNFHRKIHFVPLFFFFLPLPFFRFFLFSVFVSSCLFFFYNSLFRLTFDYVTSSLQFDSLPSSFPRYLTLLCNYRHLLYREFPLILYYKSELFNIVFLLVILIKFQVTILKSYWYIFFLTFKYIFNLFVSSSISLSLFFRKLFIFVNIDVFFINRSLMQSLVFTLIRKKFSMSKFLFLNICVIIDVRTDHQSVRIKYFHFLNHYDAIHFDTKL